MTRGESIRAGLKCITILIRAGLKCITILIRADSKRITILIRAHCNGFFLFSVGTLGQALLDLCFVYLFDFRAGPSGLVFLRFFIFFKFPLLAGTADLGTVSKALLSSFLEFSLLWHFSHALGFFLLLGKAFLEFISFCWFLAFSLFWNSSHLFLFCFTALNGLSFLFRICAFVFYLNLSPGCEACPRDL
jgi:hypothetical protein